MQELQAVHCQAAESNPHQRQQQFNLQHDAPNDLAGGGGSQHDRQ